MRLAASLVWLQVGPLACRAESLGVEVPRGGPESVSVEDLQRDAFALRGPGGPRLPGSPAHRAVSGHFAQRLQQMRMVPGFDRSWEAPLEAGGLLVCGRKDGAGPGSIVVLARDPGAGHVAGPVDLAALISLAKAHDTRERPRASLVLCGQFGGDVPPTLGSAPPVPVAERVRPVVLVTAIAAGESGWMDIGTLGSGGATRAWGGGPGALPEGLETVDHRLVAQGVVKLFDALSQPPP